MTESLMPQFDIGHSTETNDVDVQFVHTVRVSAQKRLLLSGTQTLQPPNTPADLLFSCLTALLRFAQRRRNCGTDLNL